MTKEEVLQKLLNNEQQYDWVPAVAKKALQQEVLNIVAGVIATNGEENEALDLAVEILEKEPKHGRWINRDYCQVDEDAYEVATCSNCKAEITLEYPYDNFCPNCGADMRGEGD